MGTAPAQDKYINIPPAMQKDNEDLDAFFEEQKKAKEEGKVPPIEGAPVEEPIAEEEVIEQPPVSEGETVPKSEFEKSEHKYRVLQEKYNAELPELHRQVRFLYDQNQTLQRQIQDLQNPVAEPKLKPSLRESVKMKALKNELSPEVFENLAGVIEEVAETQRQDFEERTAKLRGEVSKDIGKSREDLFWDAVYGSHEEYDQLKNSEDFQNFWIEPEGLTGLTKGEFMKDAYRRLDAKTYVRYLNAFKKGANPNPSNKILTSGGPNEDKLKGKIGAPRGGSGGGASQVIPKTMTRDQAQAEYDRASSEYEKMSNDFNKGLWEGREKDYDKKEAELIAIIQKTSKIIGSG